MHLPNRTWSKLSQPQVQAESDLVSAEAALRVLGITDPESLVKAPPSFEASVKAPIDGQVVEQDVAVGQLLQPGTTQCFVISKMSTVWILVNVYQKDLPYVRVGDAVTITTDSYPDVFQGKISYVAAALDPNTRTLQARIETNNPGYKLKKDMYVVASVDAGTIQNAIAVPDSAVLRDTREPAVRVRRIQWQSVWPAFHHCRRKLERSDPGHRGTEPRRSHYRRR